MKRTRTLRLPIAMVVLSVAFIPRFYRLRVQTAYEILEARFDLKTRQLAAFLFLLQRGLSAGITIYAPAIVLSRVLGWSLNGTSVVIGGLVTATLLTLLVLPVVHSLAALRRRGL